MLELRHVSHFYLLRSFLMPGKNSFIAVNSIHKRKIMEELIIDLQLMIWCQWKHPTGCLRVVRFCNIEFRNIFCSALNFQPLWQCDTYQKNCSNGFPLHGCNNSNNTWVKNLRKKGVIMEPFMVNCKYNSRFVGNNTFPGVYLLACKELSILRW